MLSLQATKEEYDLAALIAKREGRSEQLDLKMDLIAVHANGCPLDFKKLLGFEGQDFFHDIRGIQRHIDRTTGKLGDCFLPRCAKRK